VLFNLHNTAFLDVPRHNAAERFPKVGRHQVGGLVTVQFQVAHALVGGFKGHLEDRVDFQRPVEVIGVLNGASV
jgi:hypothetical protein